MGRIGGGLGVGRIGGRVRSGKDRREGVRGGKDRREG